MPHQVRTMRQARRVKSIRPPRKPVTREAVELAGPALGKRFLPSAEEQEEADLERRAVPLSEVQGTNIERIVYKALKRKHIWFDFQSSLAGGRWGWRFGRQVADFAFPQLALVVEVQGGYWHSPVEQEMRDKSRELILNALGWRVLVLPEEVIQDARRLDRWLNQNVVHAGLGTKGAILSESIAA